MCDGAKAGTILHRPCDRWKEFWSESVASVSLGK